MCLPNCLRPVALTSRARMAKTRSCFFSMRMGHPKPEAEVMDKIPDYDQPYKQELRAEVSGTITDATTHQPMPGVNVIVKGTINGTSSGADGTYTLKANDTDVLVFSSIGYKAIEENVGARSVVDIVLEEDIASLKEVIINAGYYDVKEKEATGSIVKVTSDVIEKQPVTNPLGALQGRMAGVFIEQTTGIPGGDFNIQIRGRNSLRSADIQSATAVDGNLLYTSWMESLSLPKKYRHLKQHNPYREQ